MRSLRRDAPSIASRPSPTLTAMALLLTDLLALLLAWGCALFLRALTGGTIDPLLYLRLLPALLLFPALYLAFGLYPALGLHSAMELQRLSKATTLGFLLLASGAFLSKSGPLYSRFSFLLAFILALFLVPIFRALIRHLAAKKPWWGGGVYLVGEGKEALGHLLLSAPVLGFKPVASPEEAHALLVWGRLEGEEALHLLRRFPRILLVPPQEHGLLWAEVRDLGGLFALELRQNLLLPANLFLKRAMDLAFGGPLLLLFLLLLPPVALAIYLEDRGGPFYRHLRVGQGGRRFHVLKFRTMRPNAEEALETYLAANLEARELWQKERKLREDPRVTRVGRFLRRWSIDELPQVLNVLKGEMSLVGPRPVTEEELAKYGESLELYLRVRPGLTGLWQVSGRNHLTYERRVALDRYYVQNWSPWLDLYILGRTILAVLGKRGAW